MSRTIAVIASQGERFTSEIVEDDHGRVYFMADADIDCDGGSNPHHDPCWQPDTTLHHRGRPIDSETVPGIVVPPAILRGVKGVVLGCRARATNTRTGQSADAVVFDQGPTRKTGELSPALAKLIGINPNPNTGGEDAPVVLYELWPGEAAVVNGVTYALQPA
jgi:hypothetical protein